MNSTPAPSSILPGQDLLTEAENEQIYRFAETNQLPDTHAIANFLSATFGISLVTDADIVNGFVHDESHLPGNASGLTRPSTRREVATVLRTCTLCHLPVTICSGRSNLTGSATPEGGIVMALSSLQEPPFSVNESARTVNAPVGMFLEEMRKAVLAATSGRLGYPVDPTSRAEATVGGTIACNASGFTPGAAGATRDWVERIEVILPCGSLVAAHRGEFISRNGAFLLEACGATREIPVPQFPRPSIKNAGGPFSSVDGAMDFVDFIIGSEGIYGAVVAATLRLVEQPETFLDFFFSMSSESEAVALRLKLEEVLGGHLDSLSACEYFGVNCRRYMTHEDRFFSGSNPVAVYIQVPSSKDKADAVAEEWFVRLCELGVDPDAILLLDNDRDRALFMEARHSMPANSLEVVTRRGTFTLMTDTVVPKERFAEFLDFAHAQLNEHSIDYLAFGHLGDCHLHFSMMPERSQLEAATGIYESIVAKSAELGGVYSGEHGTGKRKREDFAECNGERGINDIRRTKAALDPEFLLNRGNVVTPPQHIAKRTASNHTCCS